MTEQEANDVLEKLCGSVDKAFRVSYLWHECEQTISGDRFNATRKPRNIVDVFVAAATARGYSMAAINHYVTNIQGAT